MVGHNAPRESCDVFFYEMAQRVGIEGLNAMNARLGLGQRPDLPFSGMSAGVNPSRAWKQEKQGSEWLIGDTINTSIGSRCHRVGGADSSASFRCASLGFGLIASNLQGGNQRSSCADGGNIGAPGCQIDGHFCRRINAGLAVAATHFWD